MPTLDTRRDAFDAGEVAGQFRVIGCRIRPAFVALTAAAIYVAMDPGEIVLGNKVAQLAGAVHQLDAGNTLGASSEVYSAIVAYYNEALDAVIVIVVDGAEALTTAGATAPSDDDIVDALPNEDYVYTVIATVKVTTTAGSVVAIDEINHTARSFGIIEDDKLADVQQQHDDGTLYKPFGSISFSIDAANIAAADVITDYPMPLIWGRIKAWRFVTEKAITTGGKAATPHLEIGTTAVTGSDSVVMSGAYALGVVTALGAPTAANTFKPGDIVSIVAATVTAFTEGRVRFVIDLEERVS